MAASSCRLYQPGLHAPRSPTERKGTLHLAAGPGTWSRFQVARSQPFPVPRDLRVTQASDGLRGIEALRADPDTDLILMDVMMPGMDGYATMTAIRQMPEFKSLPIIAVTARAMPGDREKSLAAGANDYVTKPVDTDELLACMERWLAQG